MDVHRARFVPYPASAINSLAFSHQSQSASSGGAKADERSLRLAVGRANGDIEIWNPLRGDWVQESVIPGAKERSVEGLAWTQEPDEDEVGEGKKRVGRLRLFSIGYSSSVTEWDLGTGLPLRHSGGNTSEIWCLVAQPRQGAEAQSLVTGCADGSLIVFSTADGDLQFRRFLARPVKGNVRCLSLAFQKRDVLVAGYSNSQVKVFDFRSGSTLRVVSYGGGPEGGPADILVWAMTALPNGDIVTGDSSGEVRILDGTHYSQAQRLSGGHEADVLAVAASRDGKTIFSTGPDRRIVAYQLQQRGGKSDRTYWSQTSYQRYHSHDVKALAIHESKRVSVLVSGGVDTELNIVPVKHFGEENHRCISGLPQSPPVACSRRGRLLVSWWQQDCWIWQVNRPSRAFEAPRLLTKMKLTGEENITSASISRDGTVLAIATLAEVRVFHLRLRGMAPDQTVRIRKIPSPSSMSGTGARQVYISPDGRWLVAITPFSAVKASRILLGDDDRPRISEHSAVLGRLTLDAPDPGPFDNAYARTITRAAFSADSRLLAVGDISGRIESWILSGDEDVTAQESEMSQDDAEMSDDEDETAQKVLFFGQQWITNSASQFVPRVESMPMLLTFRPQRTAMQQDITVNNGIEEGGRRKYSLVVVTAKHNIYEFDMLSGRPTDWSMRNSSCLPVAFRKLKDRSMGSAWHVTADWQRLWLYGSSWVFMVDLSQDVQDPEDDAESDAEFLGVPSGIDTKRKKRKREEDKIVLATLGQSGAGSRKQHRDVKNLTTRALKLVDDGGPVREWKTLRDADSLQGREMDIDEEPLRISVPEHKMVAGTKQAVEGSRSQHARYWLTTKYRPILGLVPLSDEIDNCSPGQRLIAGDEVADAMDEDDAEDEARSVDSDSRSDVAPARVLEAILVERPTWDLGLPEPLRGIHERD